MSIWKIAWRSIQQRALASTLTAVSMALGVALVICVLVVYGVIYQSFHRGGEGYDLIVGAKGSGEQLVLNTVYYLSQPIENISYAYYEQLAEGRTGDPMVDNNVELVVPVCMGHSYRGFRVVGTTPEMFDELTYLEEQEYKWAEGRNFRKEDRFDAVVGAVAAREAELSVGGTFQAIHGQVEEGGKAHKQTFNVVGILEHTGTPNDRAIFVNMEGFYNIHAAEQATAKTAAKHQPVEKPAARTPATEKPAAEHSDEEAEHGDHAEEHADDHAHDAHQQVTALLVRVKKGPGVPDLVAKRINAGAVAVKKPVYVKTGDKLERTVQLVNEAQAVVPARVIANMFEGVVGKIQLILLVMAVLIVVVAGIGIMVSIYNSMSDRRHDIAIMRALGARRVTVMVVILAESILLSLGGGALGLLLGHGLIGALSPAIVKWSGVSVGLLQFRLAELILIPGLVALASIVGYLPAMSAYKTDVARSLQNTP
jgi:putative ABC transport system permease protein